MDANGKSDDDFYRKAVKTWAHLIDFDHWDVFTYGIMSGHPPVMTTEQCVGFDKLNDWFAANKLPATPAPLKDALDNFRLVLDDFRSKFFSQIEPASEKQSYVKVQHPFKRAEFDPRQYAEVVTEYQAHIRLISDLALELTRAANYVCDLFRSTIDDSFRRGEGPLMVSIAIWPDAAESLSRAQYQAGERTARPYPGLARFRDSVRFQRSFAFGSPPAAVRSNRNQPL